jgi:hypothetical protein
MEGNMSTVKQEASRHFRNREREYLKDKIKEFYSERIRISEIFIEA